MKENPKHNKIQSRQTSVPQELMKHSLLVIVGWVVVDLNGMHDEQVPDDRDDQLGAPVAAAENSFYFSLWLFVIIFYSYAKYIRRDR